MRFSAEDWRVVHVAGHGALPEKDGGPGGVVLSDGIVSRAAGDRGDARRAGARVHQLLPSRRLPRQTRCSYDRVGFASGVARTLIDLGVRCVVAAGWAVDDAAASEFATTFYKALLQKERFIDAVARARTAAFRFDGNTWAAYQCYGDPDWRLIEDDGDWADAAPPAERVGRHRLDGRTEARAAHAHRAIDVSAVRPRRFSASVSQRLKDRWLAMGWTAGNGIGELFAEAHAAAGDIAEAIGWYDVVLGSATGDCSIRAFEQRSNLRVRVAWDKVDAAREAQLTVTNPDAGRAGRARGMARRRTLAAKALRQAIAQARRTIRAEDQRLAEPAHLRRHRRASEPARRRHEAAGDGRRGREERTQRARRDRRDEETL